ncbi:MAG: arylesterase [Desulfofustis sp.]
MKYIGSRLGVLILSLSASCDSPSSSPENTAKEAPSTDIDGIIIAMGDSLTAGLGVAPDKSYPALLEQMLAERGYEYRVVNAGISGETSSGARSRVDWIMKLKPDIVIVETGANDGLRAIDPDLIEENIDHIISRFEQENVTVVLAGMQMVTNLGPDYVSSFNELYPRLAAKHQVIFMPFFLEGVAADPSLNQSDTIHPNSAGYRVIAKKILPFVLQAIASRDQSLQ